MENEIKRLAEIRREKPLYYVSIEGSNEFESESLKECKAYLCGYIKENRQKVASHPWDFFICMYSIAIDA